jgi:hypothetical protein
MDRAINPAAAKQGGISRINNCIYVNFCDIIPNYFQWHGSTSLNKFN